MDAFKSLEDNLNKEIRLEISNDGKTGKIRCKTFLSTDVFHDKEVAYYLAGYLYAEKVINDVELENLNMEIKNSVLPER